MGSMCLCVTPSPATSACPSGHTLQHHRAIQEKTSYFVCVTQSPQHSHILQEISILVCVTPLNVLNCCHIINIKMTPGGTDVNSDQACWICHSKEHLHHSIMCDNCRKWIHYYAQSCQFIFWNALQIQTENLNVKCAHITNMMIESGKLKQIPA